MGVPFVWIAFQPTVDDDPNMSRFKESQVGRTRTHNLGPGGPQNMARDKHSIRQTVLEGVVKRVTHASRHSFHTLVERHSEGHHLENSHHRRKNLRHLHKWLRVE